VEPQTALVRLFCMTRAFLPLLACLCACGTTTTVENLPAPVVSRSDTWTEIAASPLEARHDSVGVWTGKEVLVVGGTTDVDPCSPGTDCEPLGSPSYRADGAAYDPATDTWRRIADAPSPVQGGIAAWTGHEMVVVSRFATLAFDPGTDEWRQLDPAPHGFTTAVSMDGDVVFGSYDQRPGVEDPDWVLHVDEGSWRPVPRDPFGESYDRSFAWDGERLWLLSMAVEHHGGAWDGSPSRVAVLEGDTWEVVGETPDLVYEQRWWWFEDLLVVAPGPYRGGIARAFDPSGGAWETLANGAVPEGSCRMPRVGPGPQWLAGGGPLLTSAQPDATLLAPRCDALPEPDVAVWAGDELIMWGGPDEGYGGNTAVGLRWRPPAP